LAACTPQKCPGGQVPPHTDPSAWNVQVSATTVVDVVSLPTVVVVTFGSVVVLAPGGSVVVGAQSVPPAVQHGRQTSALVSRQADRASTNACRAAFTHGRRSGRVSGHAAFAASRVVRAVATHALFASAQSLRQARSAGSACAGPATRNASVSVVTRWRDARAAAVTRAVSETR
jgi:hypothetical protein